MKSLKSVHIDNFLFIQSILTINLKIKAILFFQGLFFDGQNCFVGMLSMITMHVNNKVISLKFWFDMIAPWLEME